MKKASITETKNQLSALLDAVRHGESILIMDRGRPIARLEPVTATLDEATGDRVARLERNGILRRPAGKPDLSLIKSAPPSPSKQAGAVDVLLNERDEVLG